MNKALERGPKKSASQPTNNPALQRGASPAPTTTNSASKSGDFHNPYNFVPAPPRNIDKVKGTELGDRPPVGHGTYLPDHWSGKIAVTLTVTTPLLIPDAPNATEDAAGHKTFDLRLGPDGKPYLPPTSMKGMLRSAYEMVTNSRFSIFQGHDERLAYRTPPTPAGKDSKDANKLVLIPAVVINDRQIGLQLRLLEAQYIGMSAKLPRYNTNSRQINRGEQTAGLKYEDTQTLPQHGDTVWVEVNAKGVATRILKRGSEKVPPDSRLQKGWACVTGANINSKKNERVFVEVKGAKMIPITDREKTLWKELIRNYKATHTRDLKKRDDQQQSYGAYLGDDPGKTGWSKHIWPDFPETLERGTLCYVHLSSDGKVQAIAPVTIPRLVYDLAPEQLIHDSVRPAQSMAELSPVDRVFGWVNQQGKGSYKGQLRVGPAKCLRAVEDAIHQETVTLAILSQPKPAQARFYIAETAQGEPLSSQKTKGKGYQQGQSLRGRKIYPHHRKGLQPEEYKRTEKDDQNRTITAWVTPDTKFSFTIDVINLSAIELGALLWILNLDRGHYHRLGGGKSLGFGSIQLTIDWNNTHLQTGQQWQTFYRSLTQPIPIEAEDPKVCLQHYQEAIATAYGNGSEFHSVQFIQAFCQAATGFHDGKPIHYPRTTPQKCKNQTEDNPIYEWFVDNESLNQSNRGLKLALPPLWHETGLPYKAKL